MNMAVLKNILRNYWFVLLLGVMGFFALTFLYGEFDFWYLISVCLLSGGGVACIVYGIIKILK